MKTRKKINSNTFLFIITIALFIVMYAAGMIIFADKGFAKPQMFMNLLINNAGLIVISCGMTIVMITGGIDISVGSVTALVCMVSAYSMEKMGYSYCFSGYRTFVWSVTGISGSISGYSAIYRQLGRIVLRPRTYVHGKYRDDFYQKLTVFEMGTV